MLPGMGDMQVTGYLGESTFGRAVGTEARWRSLKSKWQVRKWKQFVDAQFFQKYFSEKEERNQWVVLRIKGVYVF